MPELIYAYRRRATTVGRAHIKLRESDGGAETVCRRLLAERDIAERIFDFELPVDTCRRCAAGAEA